MANAIYGRTKKNPARPLPAQHDHHGIAEMSLVGATTVAPPQIICRRHDDDDDRTTPLLPPRELSSLHDESTQESCSYYAGSCLYYLFCHAIDNVVLSICCSRCQCLCGESLEPRTRPQKLFTFCVKQISNLWASAFLIFVASRIIFRPALKPVLSACTVNEFDLIRSPDATDPHLHFNLSTHLLFKTSTYMYYSVEHPAAAVFYAGEKLGPVDDGFEPFKQKPHESNVVNQVVAGRLRNAGSNVVETFLRERVQGRFEMVMRIRVAITYDHWPFIGEYLTFFDCPLSSPVPHIGQPNMSPPALCRIVKIY